MPLDKSEIGQALLLYDRAFFWEYGEREIPKLGPELVIPRMTCYGTLEDVTRLFVIYPTDTIREVADNDRELDITEKTFFKVMYTIYTDCNI